MTKRNRYLRVGIFCTWIVGISYISIVICALFSPPSIASYIASKTYFQAFKGYEGYFIFLKWMMAVANGATVGFVTAIFFLRDDDNDAYFTLFTILCLIGLGIGMFQSVIDATQVPHLAKSYASSSKEIQHVIIAFGVANPAIYALSLGLPGLWFIIMSSYYRRRITLWVLLINLLWGIGSILTVLAHMMVWIWLIQLVTIGALISIPFWVGLNHYFFKKEFDIKNTPSPRGPNMSCDVNSESF